jgi:hypothetical protein
MTVPEFLTIIRGARDRDQLRLMEAVIQKQLADGIFSKTDADMLTAEIGERWRDVADSPRWRFMPDAGPTATIIIAVAFVVVLWLQKCGSSPSP